MLLSTTEHTKTQREPTKTREDFLFQELPDDRKAIIEVILTCYKSISFKNLLENAYVTMPISTGKLQYQVFDRYGVKNIDELKKKQPDALYHEIILPNIEMGKKFVESIGTDLEVPIISPGMFEATRLRWTQNEYMILWLKVL